MIFSERRLAVASGIFMLAVFFLCAFEYIFEYKFINITAFVLIFLTVIFVTLRFVFSKSSELLEKLGYVLFFIAAVSAAVFFCMLHYNISQKPVLDYLEKYKDAPVYIKAEIKKASSVSYVSTFDLKVYEINGEKIKKFKLYLSAFEAIEADENENGNILEAYVILKNLEDDSFVSGLNLAYYKSGGYYITAECAEDYEIKITPVKSKNMDYYLEKMRNYTRDVFLKNIKYDYHDNTTQEAAVVYGIFTGNKDYINSAVKDDFRKSGIFHALSVSGMHLSILCGIIFLFMNLFKVNKKITCVIIIISCLFFMAFSGFSVSVIRSGIMMILFYAAFLIGRKSDALTSLLTAGAVILFLNPYNILNLSFQLSFFATLGIISVNKLNNKIILKLDSAREKISNVFLRFLIKLSKIIISSFSVTTAATVFTLPFITYNFKTLSLIAPVTNLLTAPLITAVMFLSLFVMIFSFVPFVPVITVFSVPVYFVTKILLYINEKLAALKYGYISVESTNGTGFYIFASLFLSLVVLCFITPQILTGLKIKKIIKPVLYISTILIFLAMAGTLIYPRIIFKDTVRFAYYSDDKNQNIIMFQKDYDSVDIIDMTHGTQSHIRSVYEIITENGALRINSVILTDYRKRHVQMIKKYLTYSEINKIYVPEPSDEYDTEVLNMLYYLSLTEKFELINYGNTLKSGEVLITVDKFNYNKMAHMAVDIEYKTENANKKLLYLAIGYKEGYAEYSNVKDNNYDIVFYGTHKHNQKDDNYISDIKGSYAGVLSTYLDEDKKRISQQLESSVTKAYSSGSLLFISDNYKSIIFALNKNGGIKYYLK